MKRSTKILSILLLVGIIIGCLASCDLIAGRKERVDYVANTKLDTASESLKQQVTVKAYVDGDTTHFYVPNEISESGVLKARYLAINTPESTGKIEEYGKKAAEFTKTKLKGASSIMIESDDNKWNVDSTGDRFLVWVWYRNSDTEEYRNLNIEILQEGLAIASNSGQNRYGAICLDAIAQAKAHKLNVYSGEKDPGFYYGEAINVDLVELRDNLASYDGKKVAFEATVICRYSDGVYVEAYDEETGTYSGIYVYYGMDISKLGARGESMISTVGNKLRIVGKVSYYETGKSYQVTDLKYDARNTSDPDNLQLISQNNASPYTEITAEKFTSKVNRIVVEDGEEVAKEVDYADLILATSISMKNLVVKSIYTTDKEDSSSKGAMTITCTVGDITIDVRTTLLRDADGKVITAEYFEGKTLDVKGIVDCFDGTYQIKVFTLNDITIK